MFNYSQKKYITYSTKMKEIYEWIEDGIFNADELKKQLAIREFTLKLVLGKIKRVRQ